MITLSLLEGLGEGLGICVDLLLFELIFHFMCDCYCLWYYCCMIWFHVSWMLVVC